MLYSKPLTHYCEYSFVPRIKSRYEAILIPLPIFLYCGRSMSEGLLEHRVESCKCLGQRGGCAASSLPWTSREKTLASSGICLEEYRRASLEGRGAQESWSIFKDHLLQAQERCIPTKRKSGRNARRHTWKKKELQTQAEKGGLQRMETRTGSLEGIQRNRPGSHGAS